MRELLLTLRRVLRPAILMNLTISLIGFMSFILLLNDHALLKIIPINTKDLNPIGKVTASKGQVVRKLITDSLQLPLAEDDAVYEDDLVTTGEGAAAELSLSHGNSLTTEPNTILRIRNENEKLFLQLHQGSVITNFSNESWITLKTGVRNHHIQIRKGTYLIRNSSGGIQITAYSSQHSVKKGLNKSTARKTVQAKAEIEGELNNDPKSPDDSMELGSEAAELLEEAKLSVPLSLPQPENKIVYLLQTGQSIKIAASSMCEEFCELKVLRGKTLVANRKFAKGQVPIYEIYIEEITTDTYKWSFTDQGQTESFEFQVAPLSVENLQKFLDQGRNVEIL